MRPRALFLLILFLACSAAIAQYRTGARHEDSSRNVVSGYCRMDYEGSRLTRESWPRMKSLTTWKENPDWLGFTVVSQYDISAANEGLRGANVEVHYAVLGHFEPGAGYIVEPHGETVSFHLKDVDGAWKIEDVDPSINPHISKPRAIAWLKSALAAEKDPAEKIALEKALKNLGATP